MKTYYDRRLRAGTPTSSRAAGPKASPHPGPPGRNMFEFARKKRTCKKRGEDNFREADPKTRREFPRFAMAARAPQEPAFGLFVKPVGSSIVRQRLPPTCPIFRRKKTNIWKLSPRRQLLLITVERLPHHAVTNREQPPRLNLSLIHI